MQDDKYIHSSPFAQSASNTSASPLPSADCSDSQLSAPDGPSDFFPSTGAIAVEQSTSSSCDNPEAGDVRLLPTSENLSAVSSAMVDVVDVQFKSSGKVYYFDPGELEIPDETDVIIETSRGLEFGHCTKGNHLVTGDQVIAPLRPVVRIATEADRNLLAEYRSKEPEALRICAEKIQKHGLDMKLISAEYAFDGSKILFFFTSDGRVDFRDLVKDLAYIFRTRIELRQIGVRDEAKMLGGLGICGHPFCCSRFLDSFQPVSIKMAKTQGLSLNPTKISGTCGRLMCCLKYEQEAYESLQKESPKNESLVDTPEGKGTIEEIVLMRRQAKVRLQAHPDTVKLFSWDSLTVLRSGRARKEDSSDQTTDNSILQNTEAEPQAAASAVSEENTRQSTQVNRRHNTKKPRADLSDDPSLSNRKTEPRTENSAGTKRKTGQKNRSGQHGSGQFRQRASDSADSATISERTAAEKTDGIRRAQHRPSRRRKPGNSGDFGSVSKTEGRTRED